MTSTGRICTKCGKWKQADSFRKVSSLSSGLHSWCKPCDRQNKSEWKKKNESHTAMHKMMQEKEPDPLIYSKAVCEHVEQIVSNAIRRYENRTGNEAPPHLTAILTTARSIVDQHPADAQPFRQCESKCCYCGRAFLKKQRQHIFCSGQCREAARFQSIWKDPVTRAARLERNRRYRERRLASNA